MPGNIHRFSKRRLVWSAVTLVALFALWYAFRPEKLFINKKVDEAPPAALAHLTPLYTGSFESNARETTGRATVYQQPNGSRLLTLSNLSASNQAGLDVILLDGNTITDLKDFTLSKINDRDVGEIKANASEQSYTLPADLDINRFNTVAIYSAGLHAIFGTAKLEVF